MFQQQAQGSFIPTKSIIVKPEAQVDVSPRGVNQIRFLIPQYLGFIDPKGTTLNYDLIMSGRGKPIPNGRAGVHSCWRDFRIQDGTGGTTLEEVQDYNVLVAQWWGYTQNDSIGNKRNMFEGRQVNPAEGSNVYYSGAFNWSAGDVTVSPSPVQLNIRQPVYSGILSGEKVFPVVATQGLRLQMTLDSVARSVVYPNGMLGFGINAVGGAGLVPQSRPVGLKVAIASGDHSKTDVTTAFSIQIQKPSEGPGGRGVNNNALPYNNNPFDIGDMLYINNGVTSDSLGVITTFGKDADDDLEITFIPARPITVGLVNDYAEGDSVYIKSADRLNGLVVANVPPVNVVQAGVNTDYTLSNIEMVCAVVSPPEGYIKGLQSQIASSKGLAMDFKTYSLHRVNLNAVNGLTNQLIPDNSARAYSILSVPLAQGSQLDASMDSLQGVVDGCQNYQYVLGGHLIPDRPIDLIKYTNATPHTDALHLIELEKSLVNCGYGVRNLQRIPERFLIGRGFSKYGQVGNLSGRDLSLRVEYSGAIEQKLYNHYVCHLRRMVINPSGVNAF